MLIQILKKKRIKDPVCSYLRKLISHYGFGWSKPGGVDRYTNEQLIRWYNASGYMGTPTNSDLYAHFAGQNTLYFWADGRKSSPLTLSMIDIDCHGHGNAQSAKAFADWLKDNYFPNLYHEPSTHGKGRHGYFVLYKDGFSDVEKMVIPGPKKLPIFKAMGSTANHPITKDEIEAISGPNLDFARSWIPESVETSSRAKVEPADLAIALPIVKYCSQKCNADGTMPTRRIKVIWDRLFAEGEVDRAFDYHRWRVIRNLIEVQGGLEMEDRHFSTGFVNEAGTLIKGLAAKWKMADWLIEKLEEIVELGYQQEIEETAKNESSPISLQQELQSNQDEVSASSLMERGGGALLEQNEYQDVEDLFDRDWIIEFRRSMPPMIGLIWGGSIKNMRREAG